MAKYSEIVSAAGLPELPADRKYVIAAGIVVRDQSGNPITCERKKRGRKAGSNGKPAGRKAMPEYAVPDGGLRTHEVPDFQYGKMAALKPKDFADILDYHRWRTVYFAELGKIAQKEVDRLLAIGGSAEERAAAQKRDKILTAAQAQLDAVFASGNKGLAADLVARLGEMFAAAQAKVG